MDNQTPGSNKTGIQQQPGAKPGTPQQAPGQKTPGTSTDRTNRQHEDSRTSNNPIESEE